MAKVLLVDTNFASAPIYSVLKGFGYTVHVIGSNPHDTLAKSAEQYWNIDYSDTAALSDLIEKEAFDYLVPVARIVPINLVLLLVRDVSQVSKLQI